MRTAGSILYRRVRARTLRTLLPRSPQCVGVKRGAAKSSLGSMDRDSRITAVDGRQIAAPGARRANAPSDNVINKECR